MKEHQRKSEAYIKSFNIGWTKSKEYEENYARIFRKNHEFVVKRKGIWEWEECKYCGILKEPGFETLGFILPLHCKGGNG